MLDATINGFVELERSGMLGPLEFDAEGSWLRILAALDTILRAWTSSTTTPTTTEHGDSP